MFARAFELASRYTHPLVASARLFDGRVECTVGTFVILNEEGWIVTAAHLLDALTRHAADRAEIAEYERRAREIRAGKGTREGKARRVRALGANADWITNYSLWTGWDSCRVGQFHVIGGADLALGRLDPFEPSTVGAYPVLRDDELPVGTSVCKLGYPFHSVTTRFDEAADAFVFGEQVFPMPLFALDGMVTRTRSAGLGPDGAIEITLVETSTPGLRGQSGGPIVDAAGRVCAIQVHTVHYPLGFSPVVEQGGRRIEEHQFLNVGVGVHAATIRQFLAQHDVDVRLG